jgi:tetratricopeptide (TPR) repeat protein
VELGRPYWLALLAEAYEALGQPAEGLVILAEAMAVAGKNEERGYEAALYHLKGELLLQQANQKAKGKNQKAKMETKPSSPIPDPQSEAEACFRKAINIAQRQSAKSWELRATMSLARVWQQQGKQHEAHQMLSEVYNWVTEGFDTKDLQEAKAVLEALGN